MRLLGGFRLELAFSDGLTAELDFQERLAGRGGAMKPLADPAFFAQVQVDAEAGTLVWPNGVDFDPDVLYSMATGTPLPRAQPA
jgi:hypothetical protein